MYIYMYIYIHDMYVYIYISWKLYQISLFALKSPCTYPHDSIWNVSCSQLFTWLYISLDSKFHVFLNFCVPNA